MSHVWHGPSLTSNEQGVTGEHSPLVAILHVITDTILGVARGVQGLDRDTISDLEDLTIGRGRGNRLAIGASNHGKLAKFSQLTNVSQIPARITIMTTLTILSLPPA